MREDRPTVSLKMNELTVEVFSRGLQRTLAVWAIAVFASFLVVILYPVWWALILLTVGGMLGTFSLALMLETVMNVQTWPEEDKAKIVERKPEP